MRQAIFSILVGASTALGAVQFLPESHHQQFQTFAFFADEQTGYLVREGNRGWGSLGTSFALMEFPDWPGSPQVIFYGAAHTSFRGKTSIVDFATETMDAKLGIAFEGTVSEKFRFSAGIVHYSGHALDGILDPSLIGLNLSLDQFIFRLIYDDGTHWRMGASFKPVFNSDPGTNLLSGDQFIEVWPFGINANPLSPTPFVAVSADEGGVNYSSASFHVQLGAYFGNHTEKERRTVVRFAIGYYNGSDPRTKYAAFLNSRTHFVYGGVLITL